jgi:lincosamide nucleotidyltransferase A/C/D/E
VGAEDVTEILGRLDGAGIWYCIEGGWGVDALLGEQRREHRDLDLGVRREDLDRLRSLLQEFERDDSEWPSSVVFTDGRGRRVDVHPLTFDESGDGWQAKIAGGAYRWPGEHLDARGRIGAYEVRCITPDLQLRWHEYEGFDDVDWTDMRSLAERFGLPFSRERPGFVVPRRAVDAKLHSRHEG